HQGTLWALLADRPRLSDRRWCQDLEGPLQCLVRVRTVRVLALFEDELPCDRSLAADCRSLRDTGTKQVEVVLRARVLDGHLVGPGFQQFHDRAALLERDRVAGTDLAAQLRGRG